MRTKVDFTKLTARQREVLTALTRQLSKNEVKRFLRIAEATTPSAEVFSDETKQAILDHVIAVIEELKSEHAA